MTTHRIVYEDGGMSNIELYYTSAVDKTPEEFYADIKGLIRKYGNEFLDVMKEDNHPFCLGEWIGFALSHSDDMNELGYELMTPPSLYLPNEEFEDNDTYMTELVGEDLYKKMQEVEKDIWDEVSQELGKEKKAL